MRSFLLASFAFLTLVVVGCDPATEAPKAAPEVTKTEPPKTEPPKTEPGKMEGKMEGPATPAPTPTEPAKPAETKTEPPK